MELHITVVTILCLISGIRSQGIEHPSVKGFDEVRIMESENISGNPSVKGFDEVRIMESDNISGNPRVKGFDEVRIMESDNISGNRQNIELTEKNTSAEENENDDYDTKIQENWDCSKDDAENKQSLMTIDGMIKKGKDDIMHQNNVTTNTILVLGNAGAGKTTLVQFMAGDNSKLISKETGVDTGRYLIEDGAKIGNSITEASTIYPEQLSVDSETSFTDTPGFSDTRSEKHEIVATYVMKKYLKSIKNIKIVLLVPYNSLEMGSTYKGDFMNLLESVMGFINNTDKFSESLALIATKVPNMYKITKNNVTLTPDETIIKNIADYLNKVTLSIKEEMKYCNEFKKINFFENAIKIIEYLLHTDENGNYKKINIFRQPNEAGALSDITLLQESKKSIQKTVLNNINYTAVLNNDIGYALSYKAKNYLNCLLWYINRQVSKMSSYVFEFIGKHYQSELQQFTDVYKLKPKLEDVVRKLKTLKSELKYSHNYTNYTSIIQKFITNENVQTNIIDNETIFDMRDHINSLEHFTNTGLILSTLEWAEQMKTLINNIKENLSWCSFQIKLFEHLSSYDIQKSKTRFLNSTNIKLIENDARNILLSNFDETLQNDRDLYLTLLTLKNDKLVEINDLISLTMLESNNISCDSEGTLTVTGYFIKLSEINDKEIIMQYCGAKPVKVIGIYAFHTIFIDADFNDEYFRGVDVMITAPRWEIIGKRLINIGGVPGESYENIRAADGDNYGGSGEDGRPGYPGGNGGNFFGFGINFVNEDNLVIEANGGKGGPGQDGGNGKEGKDGQSGKDKFKSNKPNSTNYVFHLNRGRRMSRYEDFNVDDYEDTFSHEMSVSHCSSDLKIYKQVGNCGENGGRGGDGGVSGIGGYSGKVLVMGGDRFPKFTIHNMTGELGQPGQGGKGGNIGQIGKSMECYKTNVHEAAHHCGGFYDYRSGYSSSAAADFWHCRYLNDNIICPENTSNNGVSNQTINGREEPIRIKNYDFYEDLYNYTLRLKEFDGNKFLSNYTCKLQEMINEKIPFMRDQFQRFTDISISKDAVTMTTELPSTMSGTSEYNINTENDTVGATFSSTTTDVNKIETTSESIKGMLERLDYLRKRSRRM